MHQRIDSLLLLIHQGWGPQAWHGTALKGAVRGILITDALWRPAPGRHNIWELVLHMAYWKYAVTRRLDGAPQGSFPRKGSNWLTVDDPSERAWKSDIALLHEQHARLVEAVETFPAERLDLREKRKWSYAEEIAGIAAHDLYHTGQLQLIKKLARSRGRIAAKSKA